MNLVPTQAEYVASAMILAALRKVSAKLHATADKLCNHPTARASTYRDAADLVDAECSLLRVELEAGS